MGELRSNRLISIAGYVYTRVRITTVIGGSRRQSTLNTRSFITNVRKNYHIAVEDSMLNAYYRHLSRYGYAASLAYDTYPKASIQLLATRIIYEYPDNMEVVRQRRGGKYYNVVRVDGEKRLEEPYTNKTIGEVTDSDPLLTEDRETGFN